MHSFHMYISCLFFMCLDDDITDNETPDRICSPTFAADYFSLHSSIFPIKVSRSAKIINGAL